MTFLGYLTLQDSVGLKIPAKYNSINRLSSRTITKIKSQKVKSLSVTQLLGTIHGV